MDIKSIADTLRGPWLLCGDWNSVSDLMRKNWGETVYLIAC